MSALTMTIASPELAAARHSCTSLRASSAQPVRWHGSAKSYRMCRTTWYAAVLIGSGDGAPVSKRSASSTRPVWTRQQQLGDPPQPGRPSGRPIAFFLPAPPPGRRADSQVNAGFTFVGQRSDLCSMVSWLTHSVHGFQRALAPLDGFLVEEQFLISSCSAKFAVAASIHNSACSVW